MKIKTVAETQRLWQCSAMLRLRSQFIVYSLQFITACAAMAADVDLSTRQPIDYFDSASMAGGVLKNLHHDDSRYLISLSPRMEGPVLVLSVEVLLPAPTNSIAIAFGDEIDPEAMTLQCTRGVWSLLIGDQIQNFADKLPPPVAGTHSYRLRLSVDTSHNRFASTLMTFQDGTQVPHTISIPSPSAWLESGTHPANWTQAIASLRGANSGIKSMRYDMTAPATLIITR